MFKEIFPSRGVLTTLEEALKSANCDFEAEQVPILHDVAGTSQVIEGYSCIRRGDSKIALGVLSARYGLSQYKDTLSFLNDVVGNGDAKFVSVASSDDGARIHIALQAPSSIVFAPGDELKCYYIASTSHDGSGSIQLTCAPLHEKTQTLLTSPDFGVIKMRHTVNVKDRLARASGTVAKMQEIWNMYSDKFSKFSGLAMTEDDARAYFAMIVPCDKEEVPTRTQNTRDKLFDLYKVGMAANLPSCKDTLLGAFVSALIFGDYYKSVRHSIVGRSEKDAMIESRLTGTAARFKADAYAACMKLVW